MQSLSQVEAIIAFAEFAAAEISPSAERLDRVLHLARTVPTVEIDPALGLQSKQSFGLQLDSKLNHKLTFRLLIAGSHEFAPPDRLAYALISATLALTAEGLGNRQQTLKALGDIQRDLFSQIETASGKRPPLVGLDHGWG